MKIHPEALNPDVFLLFFVIPIQVEKVYLCFFIHFL